MPEIDLVVPLVAATVFTLGGYGIWRAERHAEAIRGVLGFAFMICAMLPDWPTAREEAVLLAAGIFRDDAKRLALGEDWRMEVTDERGLILFRLDFSVVEAPVLAGGKP